MLIIGLTHFAKAMTLRLEVMADHMGGSSPGVIIAEADSEAIPLRGFYFDHRSNLGAAIPMGVPVESQAGIRLKSVEPEPDIFGTRKIAEVMQTDHIGPMVHAQQVEFHEKTRIQFHIDVPSGRPTAHVISVADRSLLTRTGAGPSLLKLQRIQRRAGPFATRNAIPELDAVDSGLQNPFIPVS
ncbi:MAG: hypothetical protein IKE60_26280 [Reyranella sp.]|uniref:hypothetical protein n=1 Tax=Reyranella sp. TaxID=1929291 RepID=UPI0025F185BD|nr:hypothetical protein [Reyranella sp.]MBR2818197.1 hypothetical protein [Reyranella sp.]